GFTLAGKRYDIAGNADGISSHGGPRGFSTRVWDGKSVRHGADAGVVLSYVSADGENGYPGKLVVNVTYTLAAADNTLTIDYEARTDQVTVVNLSHHAYFNLAGSGDVYGHRVQVFADRYTPIDARKVPTGAIDDVAGTPFDLR